MATSPALNISDYFAVPYRDHGRDWSGMDCWGLVRDYMHRTGRGLLPSHADVSPHDKDSVSLRWDQMKMTEVLEPEDGCIMACYRGRKMYHVGVVVIVGGRLRVLHTSEKHGTRIDTLAMVKRIFPVIKWFSLG